MIIITDNQYDNQYCADNIQDNYIFNNTNYY